MLEKEAEQLTQAAKYERNEARQGYRSDHYDRNQTTTSGDVKLHMPRLNGVSFETASAIPKSKVKLVAKMLKAIHAQESKKAARKKVKAVIAELKAMKLRDAARKIGDGIEETLTHFAFSSEHWTRIRTNNAMFMKSGATSNIALRILLQ